MRGRACRVRAARWALVEVRVGPSSPAVLLEAGRCRWVPGWPYYLAASMAHRGQGDDATMVLLGWCLVRQWIHVPALTHCGGASFSSSSKWWTLLLFTETGTHSSNCARSSTTLSWCRGRFPWSRAADHRDSPDAVH